METPTVYTVKEVAALFRVTTRTIYNMMKDGRLGFFQIGDQYRIPGREVERLQRLIFAGAQTGAPAHAI